ncbi:hypothetical protein COJ85_26365, partial [Bacillus sp. AFS076308]
MKHYLICMGLMMSSCVSFAGEPGPAAPVTSTTGKKPFPHIAWRS